MFCISYGNCMVLDMCMCECGWQGMMCEMFFVLGFQLQMRYVYNLLLFYIMESDILMKMNDFMLFKGFDVLNFFLEVNIIFLVIVFLREFNIFIVVFRILNVVCFFEYKNQIKVVFKNLICN